MSQSHYEAINTQWASQDSVVRILPKFYLQMQPTKQCYESVGNVLANIAISIENPGNSLFWKIPSVQQFLREVAGYNAIFHHCVYGGLKDKLTRWWASVDWFLQGRFCAINSTLMRLGIQKSKMEKSFIQRTKKQLTQCFYVADCPTLHLSSRCCKEQCDMKHCGNKSNLQKLQHMVF